MTEDKTTPPIMPQLEADPGTIKLTRGPISLDDMRKKREALKRALGVHKPGVIVSPETPPPTEHDDGLDGLTLETENTPQKCATRRSQGCRAANTMIDETFEGAAARGNVRLFASPLSDNMRDKIKISANREIGFTGRRGDDEKQWVIEKVRSINGFKFICWQIPPFEPGQIQILIDGAYTQDALSAAIARARGERPPHGAA